MSITRFPSFVLLVALVFAVGCTTPNPLAGWKVFFHEPDQTITNDYQDYIKKLPPEERKYAGMIQYFEDGTGQHAVKIRIPLNGTWWNHVLIYNKDNKRIETKVYSSGNYGS
jgi:hypothetical protein